uniref:Predicted protein n=1 Tax=Physcomitrium patens TaxID=3218 RepID=A9U5N8_PHYPA
MATRMETKVLDDGSAYARVRSEDGRKAVQFLTTPPNHERNRDRLKEKPLPKIVEGFKDFGEEVLSQDEGAFDASFIGILENGNIMYKKVDDFKRKERKRLYNIERELRKLENGLEDSLELITSIGLGDNDKIIEIHSREVYTMLESFQALEVTVETRYKTADKKVKPVARPLSEYSKEQISKEVTLRDPMSIGNQFTKETFEELKIGSDGSLLPEEITCFKKMSAKQEVYTMLESFQAPEVTVESRYKTADKKVKLVAGPLLEDSKEQMGEASKEASLRDPMSIGHQFTEETFEELKIGSDGSLLPEEITCFKKMLAKQGRSFAFDFYEIGCVDPNIITPMVIFTVPHVS